MKEGISLLDESGDIDPHANDVVWVRTHMHCEREFDSGVLAEVHARVTHGIDNSTHVRPCDVHRESIESVGAENIRQFRLLCDVDRVAEFLKARENGLECAVAVTVPPRNKALPPLFHLGTKGLFNARLQLKYQRRIGGKVPETIHLHTAETGKRKLAREERRPILGIRKIKVDASRLGVTLHIGPNILVVEDAPNFQKRTIGVVLAVRHTSACIPEAVFSALLCEDVARLSLWNSVANDDVRLKTKVEKVVAQQNGVLFLVSSKHVQELVRCVPQIAVASEGHGIVQRRNERDNRAIFRSLASSGGGACGRMYRQIKTSRPLISTAVVLKIRWLCLLCSIDVQYDAYWRSRRSSLLGSLSRMGFACLSGGSIVTKKLTNVFVFESESSSSLPSYSALSPTGIPKDAAVCRVRARSYPRSTTGDSIWNVPSTLPFWYIVEKGRLSDPSQRRSRRWWMFVSLCRSSLSISTTTSSKRLK
eukprot:Opistho-2@7844